MSTIDDVPHRSPPKLHFIYLFNKYRYRIFSTWYLLPVFSSSKYSLFHTSNVFGSCIIHILYTYSTNIGTENFQHGIYFPFFPLQNTVCFIILTYFVPVLFTFYILIQQIQVPNIFNMVFISRFFLFKIQFVS